MYSVKMVRLTTIRWLSAVVLGAMFFSLCFVVYARCYFGSVANGVKYVQGCVFDIRPSVFTLTGESASQTTATFEIENLSQHDAKLIGSKTSCACVVVDGLPLAFAPREKKLIHIAVTTGGEGDNQHFSQSISFFTDVVSQPLVVARIQAATDSSLTQRSHPEVQTVAVGGESY